MLEQLLYERFLSGILSFPGSHALTHRPPHRRQAPSSSPRWDDCPTPVPDYVFDQGLCW